MTTSPASPARLDHRLAFADEVRVLMVRRRMTQADLAEVLDLGQSEVSKRLRGTVPFRFDEIVFIADYFGVSIGALFGEETHKSPRPDGPDGGSRVVRHQGLEPRTRWFGGFAPDLQVCGDERAA